jgi:hypothetical protein
MRPVGLVAIARRDSYVFIPPGRAAMVVEGVDVAAMSAVLAATGLPATRKDLLELCDKGTLDRLVKLGVLEAGEHQALAGQFPARPKQKRCKRVVVAMSGAIRAASFLGIVLALGDVFAEQVDVIVSAGARRFVRPRVFGYHGMRVWSDPYRPAHGVAVPHKHLAAADLIVVAPASAATIQRLASGACSDLTSLVAAITKSPVVVVPSMNPNMWSHPPIARNVAQLRSDGFWVLEPGVGRSAADRDELGVGPAAVDAEMMVLALDAVLGCT